MGRHGILFYPSSKSPDMKWGPGAEKMIFVCYTQSTKQYRLDNSATGRMVISHDVVVHEDIWYLRPTDQQIFLPFATETDTTPSSEDRAPLRRRTLPPVPPLPPFLLPGTPESVVRKARMKARAQGSNKGNKSGSVRRPQVDVDLETNLGPFWNMAQEAEQSSKGKGEAFSSTDKEMAEDSTSFGVYYPFMVTNGPHWIHAALNGTDRKDWVKAINSELDSREAHNSWTVVSDKDKTKALCTISSCMVLQEKLSEDGRVAQLKAHLVAHGFRQHLGFDFVESYSPMISFPAIRMVLLKAAAEDKEIVQLDIVTAFLESEI